MCVCVRENMCVAMIVGMWVRVCVYTGMHFCARMCVCVRALCCRSMYLLVLCRENLLSNTSYDCVCIFVCV